MQKEILISAHATISKIEDKLSEATDLFDKLPTEIREAALRYHRDQATIQHCLRWGLQAAKELREDGHAVVAGIP